MDHISPVLFQSKKLKNILRSLELFIPLRTKTVSTGVEGMCEKLTIPQFILETEHSVIGSDSHYLLILHILNTL